MRFINLNANNEEEEVSEVPSLWILDNQEQCWWPPQSLKQNLRYLILKQAQPDIKTWGKYSVQVEGYFSKQFFFNLRISIYVIKFF